MLVMLVQIYHRYCTYGSSRTHDFGHFVNQRRTLHCRSQLVRHCPNQSYGTSLESPDHREHDSAASILQKIRIFYVFAENMHFSMYLQKIRIFYVFAENTHFLCICRKYAFSMYFS